MKRSLSPTELYSLDTGSITQSQAKIVQLSMDGHMVSYSINLGSVVSDSLFYRKHLIFNTDGYLMWALPKTDAYKNL